MHVPSSQVQRVSVRLPFAAAVVAMFASVVGVANAAEFDEKVKAPQARNPDQVKLTARAMSQEFSDTSLDARAAVIRDAAKSRRRFDAQWAVIHAVETRAPLGDLSEFGIVTSQNGEVRIDLKRYPQWGDPEGSMVRMLTHLQLDALADQWINRGMTEADVAVIRNYVATHDAEAMARQAGLPVTLGFGRVVRKYDKIKRTVPNDLVFDYFYQQSAASAEANRAWLAGLLNILEPHAARILLSYFGELESTAIWAPSDMNAAAFEMLTKIRQPDFERRAAAEVLGGAK
jgi:hypothetical protein